MVGSKSEPDFEPGFVVGQCSYCASLAVRCRLIHPDNSPRPDEEYKLCQLCEETRSAYINRADPTLRDTLAALNAVLARVARLEQRL